VQGCIFTNNFNHLSFSNCLLVRILKSIRKVYAFILPHTKLVFLHAGMDLEDIPLHVEPGLFEWLKHYKKGIPKFFTPEELQSNGFKIDLTYRPMMDASSYNIKETLPAYYKRKGEVGKAIVNKHQYESTWFHVLKHP